MALFNQSDLLAFFRPGKSSEDSFKLLVSSSNPFLKFRLVVSRNLANFGKSSLGFIHSRQVIFRDLAILGKSSSRIGHIF
jgi:hypothetical protein